ncbi:hypothetical protein OTU49_000608 [Cherax quadricarinatus]|uniref:Uncharacterized protein n=1 Tax=Cherax quadricarinatus TaxID=27406 RepID=A0AAW0XWC9_CHEQU
MHRTICGVMCVVTVLAALSLCVGVEGAPSEDMDDSVAAFSRSLFGSSGLGVRSPNLCTNNDDQKYMCEMCSKETKSSQVYALCCMGEDDAQAWCQSFLVYGINGV